MTGLLALLLAAGGAALMLAVVTGASFPWEAPQASQAPQASSNPGKIAEREG